MIVLAIEFSWALSIVKVSVAIAVTLIISAFVVIGFAPAIQTVALKGGVGNKAPSPAATTKEVPEVAGEGAVATVETAKFL